MDKFGNWSQLTNVVSKVVKGIDKVLDIQQDSNDPVENVPIVDGMAPVEQSLPVQEVPKVNPDPPETSRVDVNSSSWNSFEQKSKEHEVVLSEPNPIRDQETRNSVLTVKLDSPDIQETSELVDSSTLDSSLVSSGTIHEEPSAEDLHPHIDEESITTEGKPSGEDSPVSQSSSSPADRRGSNDECYTVASSDIEVVRHHDAWSTCSSIPQDMVNVKALYDDRRIQELRLALNHSEEEKKQLRKQLEGAREGKVSADRFLADAVRENGELRKEGEKLQEQVCKLRTESRKLKERSSAAESKSTSSTAECRRLNEKAQNLEEKNSILTRELDGLKEQHAKSKELCDKLAAETQSQKAELDSLKTLSSELELKVNLKGDVEEECATMLIEHRNSALEIERLKASLEASQMLCTEQCRQIDEMSNRITEMSLQLQQVGQENNKDGSLIDIPMVSYHSQENMTNGYEDNSEMIQQCLQKVAEMEDRMKVQSVDFHCLRSERDRLNAAYHESCTTFQLWQQQETARHNEAALRAQNAYEELNQINSSLHQRIRYLEESNTQLAVSNETQRMELERLKRDLSGSNRTGISSEVQQMQDKLKGIQRHNEVLLTHNGILIEQNKELEHDVQDMRVEMKKMQNEFVNLQVQ